MSLLKSFESIIARAISIICKFVLTTFLAKEMNITEFGEYQLVCYFTMVSVYIYGLEYYMIGNREFAKTDNSKEVIEGHFHYFISILPYTFLIQVLGVMWILPSSLLTPLLIVFILFINISEYFNQEVYRYLIIARHVNRANILLVAKNSLSLSMLLVSYFLLRLEINISIVLWIIALSYVFLLILTWYYFKKYICLKNSIALRFLKYKEIFQILKQLKPFLWLMVFTKGVEFFDKFALNYYGGAASVGVYSYLYSIAAMMYVFCATGFYIIYLPILIELFKDDKLEFKTEFLKYSALTLMFSLFLAGGVVLFIKPLLVIIGQNELIANINVLYVLVLAFFMINVSLIPKLLLYIANEEKVLMQCSGILLVINLIVNYFLLEKYLAMGAAVSLLVTYFVGFLYLGLKGYKVYNVRIRNI